jgi:outer membrane biogenesis lipoprotein LolB
MSNAIERRIVRPALQGDGETGSAKRMKRLIVLILGSIFVAGCASVPFRETPPVSMESTDPHGVLEHFKASIPERFQLFNTVVFDYYGQKFLAVGDIEINNTDRIFKVACMNPMGVKLFELSGDDHGITTQYAIEPLAKYGDIGTAIGNDIKLIYFDLVPSSDAQVWKRKYQFIFSQAADSGYTEYVFAGADGDLMEKRHYEKKARAWLVSYYEYREQNGKRYPLGIVFTNYKHGYQLTVRLKEFIS